MRDRKKICKKLLLPPGRLVAVLAASSAAMLTAVFLKGADDHPEIGRAHV